MNIWTTSAVLVVSVLAFTAAMVIGTGNNLWGFALALLLFITPSETRKDKQ